MADGWTLSLDSLIARPSWHADAACRGQGTARFFPGRGEPTEPAKALCAGCPVAGPCLETALADEWSEGVWAGTSPATRHRLRKARTAA